MVLNYQGGTDNPVYNTNGQTVNIVYSGATNGWIPISDDDVADEGTILTYSRFFSYRWWWWRWRNLEVEAEVLEVIEELVLLV
jgi:hypothetical protein